ncbi:hypothetical protein BDW22DRAFT_798931 [Trametopsis cervina]|nr:hypothetical protein BDW22DRAFT_798931 [Trametopsis cervina]
MLISILSKRRQGVFILIPGSLHTLATFLPAATTSVSRCVLEAFAITPLICVMGFSATTDAI